MDSSTIGRDGPTRKRNTQPHRSASPAPVRLLLLYHLVTARAWLALGGDRSRAVAPGAPA